MTPRKIVTPKKKIVTPSKNFRDRFFGTPCQEASQRPTDSLGREDSLNLIATTQFRAKQSTSANGKWIKQKLSDLGILPYSFKFVAVVQLPTRCASCTENAQLFVGAQVLLRNLRTCAKLRSFVKLAHWQEVAYKLAQRLELAQLPPFRCARFVTAPVASLVRKFALNGQLSPWCKLAHFVRNLRTIETCAFLRMLSP